MDTFVVILVLIVLLVLLGGTAWFFTREAGPGSGMAWLTGNRQFRSVFPSANASMPFSSRTSAIMVDESHLHQLASDLREEIERATQLNLAMEARLSALETDFGSTKQLPAFVDARVQSAEQETRDRIAKIRRDLNASRVSDSPYSVRRNDAVSDLYQKLAQLDVAIGAVVNPMLLPGEQVSVPESLYDDTLIWDNWGDVADRAYAFGESFSQSRYLLDPELALRVETFIATFRTNLTTTVYPVVQDEHRSSQQRQQMRIGIVTVVDEIRPLRREFEQTWLNGTHLDGFTDDDESDA
ncbi:MAG: hypothetical protein M9953_03065 [Thermomicrobiales bacterium]|nr:hypothetical protein [Thermomicrobiales bacterium]MCO5224297.1 hypothetical protein [Thermomicrobiales bacterium]